MGSDTKFRHWNPRRFFGKQRLSCECGGYTDPDSGQVVGHSTSCRYLWRDWTRRARLRLWLLHMVPVGGVKSFEADGTHQQRPMSHKEHMDAIMALGDGLDDAELTKFQRFQLRTQRSSIEYRWNREAPSWRHLGARFSLLTSEGVVRLRRLLLWLAPFIATVYIVIDLAK